MDGRTLFPDFNLHPTRLIIEIDGSVHLGPGLDRDCKRDFWLEDRGFKVLHLANETAENMNESQLADAIVGVYPTFPHPDAEMNRRLKDFRERHCDHSHIRSAEKQRDRYFKALNKPLNSKKYQAAPGLSPTVRT